MRDGKKAGIFWGSFGSIVGGLTWIVVLGAILGSFWVVAMAVIAAMLGIAGVTIFLNRSPERYFLVLGFVMSGISAVNLFAINVFYEKIPETVNGITTGKESVSLPVINFLLAFLLLVGLFFIFSDVLKKK